jgi:dinuclear metal center YbgI/SA1388 family protein
MTVVGSILKILWEWAPKEVAWEKDNVGLLVGSPETEVQKILVCLDITQSVVEEAVQRSANLIISHHPIIFHQVKNIRTDQEQGSILKTLLTHDIAVIAMHTNADAASSGLNNALAQHLGLQDLRPLDPVQGQMRKLVIRSHSDAHSVYPVSEFLASKSTVSWNFSGAWNDDTVIEVFLPTWELPSVLASVQNLFGSAFQSSHVVEISAISGGFGMGAIGNLPEALRIDDFLSSVKTRLGCSALRSTPFEAARMLHTVAVCGGSGASLVPRAIVEGADAFVTSDLTYHTFLDYRDQILLVDAGHYETEQIFISLCIQELSHRVFNDTKKIDILPVMTDTNPIRYI